MDRTFLKLGPITIYWYSVLIISAILIGLYFASKQAEKNKLGKEFIIDLICYLVPVGVIGARIYYVIFNFDLFKDEPLSVFKIWEGGLAIYGAIIASIIFIIYYTRKKEKDTLLVVDTLVPYLILGQLSHIVKCFLEITCTITTKNVNKFAIFGTARSDFGDMVGF